MSCRFCALAPPDCENYNGDFHLISAITSNQVEQYCTPKISQWGEIISRIFLFLWNNSKVWPPLSANILSFGSFLNDKYSDFHLISAITRSSSTAPYQWGEIISKIKFIHRDISSAYSILIIDLRERGTYLQQKNGLKKSRAQKYKIFFNIS